jgi:hypothetical protein
MLEAQEPFGDLIPFADPSWYQGVRPPHPSEISPFQLGIMLTVYHATVPLSILQRNARRSTSRGPRMGHQRDRALRWRMG